MGGQLYLNNGQPPNRENVCVSGYRRGKANFALSNFDDNNGKGYYFLDPHLGLIHFPTAEHYLHFQKIKPESKRAYYEKWKGARAIDILSGMRNPNSNYFIADQDNAYKDNWQQWEQDRIAIQMQIDGTKYQQSTEFRESIHHAINLGKLFNDGKGPATIIEDTSSLSSGLRPEETWGTGPAGNGTNILGNSQTAFAMMIDRDLIDISDGTPPALATFQTAQVQALYNEAEHQYQTGIQPNLQKVRKASGKDKGLNQVDTADLDPSLVQKLTYNQHKIQVTSYASPNQEPTNQGPARSYYMSDKGNQRLVIVDNKVTGYEFRRDEKSPWEVSGAKERFSNLETAFLATAQKSPASPTKYYTSQGGNQRLVITNNQIVGYEFRRNAQAGWESSGDLKRFESLKQSFLVLHQAKPQPSPVTNTNTPENSTQYHYSNRGNQRLVIINSQIRGYEFRRSESSRWEQSGKPELFRELANDFLAKSQLNTHKSTVVPTVDYFNSVGGNKRLVLGNGQIRGYEFRRHENARWERSGDPAQFERLTQDYQDYLARTQQGRQANFYTNHPQQPAPYDTYPTNRDMKQTDVAKEDANITEYTGFKFR